MSDETKSYSDTERLKHLEQLFAECPHAELFLNEEENEGPLGWTLRISGCHPLEITSPTFEGLIDLSITCEEFERAHNDHLADQADAASY